MGRSVASTVLMVAAWVARVLAIAIAVCVVVLCFGPALSIVPVADATYWLTRLIPSAIRGIFVFTSPLGGAFRGDFAIVAVALFILDWALMRLSSAVR